MQYQQCGKGLENDTWNFGIAMPNAYLALRAWYALGIAIPQFQVSFSNPFPYC